ncbi:MAG: sulfotransferase family 2 domain-containing protein [Pseudomonadota bacterium]
MLVSHRHRFIYTKTKKTAGTSVEAYFEPYCMAENTWSASHAREQSVSAAGIVGQRGQVKPEHQWWNHMPAQLIRQQLGEAIWSNYYKFCVVRNPFEKVVSMFFFDQRRGLIEKVSPGQAAAAFEHWVLTSALPVDREMYLIDGEICMDALVRHEQIETDLEAVCRHLRVAWNPQALPTYKTGIRPEWASVAALYTEPARQKVADTFAFELETFGYRFG